MKGCFLLLLIWIASPSAWAGDVIAGQQIYRRLCAGCHGIDGHGVMPNAPHFNRGDRLAQPDLALVNSVRNGRMAMPAFAGILPEPALFDVVAYLRTLQR